MQFVALGLCLTVVDSPTDVWRKRLVYGRPDECPVAAADRLVEWFHVPPVVLILIKEVVDQGDITLRIFKGCHRIRCAVVTGDDVGLFEHIDDRQPGFAAVNRVLDVGRVVLVLAVMTVKPKVHVGVLAKVEIFRLEHGHEMGVAQGGIGNQEIAFGELGLAIDEYRGTWRL